MASLLMRKIHVLSALLLFAISCSADENSLTLNEPVNNLEASTYPTTSTTTAPPKTSTTTSPPTTTKVVLLESTTTVAKFPMPQELDFVATTTHGQSIDGSELWLAANAYALKDEMPDTKNKFDQNILFWFWAPN